MKHLVRRTASYSILLTLSLLSTLLLAGCGDAQQTNNQVSQVTPVGNLGQTTTSSTSSLQAVWKTDTAPAFNGLAALALDSQNNLYVADTQHIFKYDSKGQFLIKLDNAGNQNSPFKQLVALSTDSHDNLYVLDAGTRLLQKFDSNGKVLAKIAGPQADAGGLKFPTDVALDRQGNLYLADVSVGPDEAKTLAAPTVAEARVQKLDANGKFGLQPIGVAPASNASLRAVQPATTENTSLVRLATDSQNNLYVLDQDHSQVRKFDATGRFVATIGTYGNANGQFLKPTSLSLDSQDNLYVVDSGRTINKFNSSGQWQVKWRGSFGKGGNTFVNLSSVKVDSQGSFYTIDPSNTLVQKFDSNGLMIAHWGSVGTGDGKFQRPIGVALDSHKNTYVTDRDNFQVQKLDSTGHFLTKWGSYGSKPGQFLSPNQIVVDSQDNVYVGDNTLGKIQKFDSTGKFLTSFVGDEGAVAIDTQDNIYTMATSNRITQSLQNFSILKYDTNGNLIIRWSNPRIERAGARYDIPEQLALDPQGNIYLLAANKLHKFDSNANIIDNWGGEGECDCNAIAVDGQGHLYELSRGLRVIATDDGKLLSTWALTGFSGASRAVAIYGIALDKQANIYVSDYFNNNVVNFGQIKP